MNVLLKVTKKSETNHRF